MRVIFWRDSLSGRIDGSRSLPGIALDCVRVDLPFESSTRKQYNKDELFAFVLSLSALQTCNMARTSNHSTSAAPRSPQVASAVRLPVSRPSSARPPSRARSDLPEPVARYDHKRLSNEFMQFEQEYQEELQSEYTF
jgi:hypothetical protein